MIAEIQSIKTQPTTATADTTKAATTGNSLLNELDKSAKTDTSAVGKAAEMNKQFPLFSILSPSSTPQGQLYPGSSSNKYASASMSLNNSHRN